MEYKVTQSWTVDLSDKDDLADAQAEFKQANGRTPRTREDLVLFLIAQHKFIGAYDYIKEHDMEVKTQ